VLAWQLGLSLVGKAKKKRSRKIDRATIWL
jgi:hypothetical protein